MPGEVGFGGMKRGNGLRVETRQAHEAGRCCDPDDRQEVQTLILAIVRVLNGGLPRQFIRLLPDFVADDAANGGPTDCPDRTTARQYRTADRPNAGANRRTLVLLRHARAAAKAQQHGHRCDADQQFAR